jgi:ComF family protein
MVAVTTPWSRWIDPAVDLLFPSHCAFCGDSRFRRHVIAGVSIRFCDGCLAGFPLAQAMCERCAAPGRNVASQHCPRCQERNYRFDATFAGGVYSDLLRAAILQLKSGQNEPLGEALGTWIASRWLLTEFAETFDCVIPMPCHWRRRWSRGGNPAESLCRPISRILSIPTNDRILRVGRMSMKQGTLSPNQRFENVRGLFRVSAGYSLSAQRILLVDDVMTTGATASDAARALRKAGAARVQVLVAARGTGRQ